MTNGKVVAALLRQGKGGGIPWIVIMTPKLVPVVTSDGPKGNVGCPITEAEVAHFVHMLRTSRRTLTDDEVTALNKALLDFGAKTRERQRRRRKNRKK